jgi:predicted methyltransferase
MKFKPLILAVSLLVIPAIAIAAQVDLTNAKRTAQDLKRDITAKPNQIIEFAGIAKGMVVADILGGGGYYSELLSQVVGEKGKVYLQNNEAYIQYIGKELTDRTKAGRLTNVVDYRVEAEKMGFANNSLDAIFFVLGYHDLYHRSKSWDLDADVFLNQLQKALKPGGILLVVDHAAPNGSKTSHSQKLHRIDEFYVRDELKTKGFSFVKASQMLRNDQDTRLISPFIPKIRRRTDRFVMLFRKN